jgi:hypothetical protein
MKKWWKSKAVWGGIVAILSSFVSLLGINIDLATQNEIVLCLMVGSGSIGGIYAIYGRLKADTKIYSSAEAKKALISKIEELERMLGTG